MELIVKHFNELTTDELWEIYKLRVSVFVVEQNCAYQDVDSFDREAYHVFLRDDEGIRAYMRVLPRGTVYDEVLIGRVIAVKRRCGLGTKIVRAGIETAIEKFGAETILVDAQSYARELYAKQGFVQISDEFLEDGIPHVKMKWTK